MNNLILSLFPGIGLLDRAFEEAGFCVVRGPDPLWGGRIQDFHPPSDMWGGVVGGPPCQSFSPLAALAASQGHELMGNLIPEFERCVDEAWPDWFLMENVEGAPVPEIEAYATTSLVIDNRWIGGEQRRRRRFSFGVYQGDGWRQPVELAPFIEWTALEPSRVLTPVTSCHGGEKRANGIARYTLADALAAQGLPAGFLDDAPFTVAGKLKAVANGVPLPLGRAIANAVKQAIAAGRTA